MNNETKITLIAIGKTGINLVKSIEKTHYGLHEIVAIGASSATLLASNADMKLLASDKPGVRPITAAMAREMAQDRRDAIAGTLRGTHQALIVTMLEDVTEACMAEVVAEVAASYGVQSKSLVFLPLDWKSRDGIHAKCSMAVTIEALRRQGSNVTVVSTAQRSKPLDDGSVLHDTYKESQLVLDHFLWATCRCLMYLGYIGIDLEDVSTVLEPCGLTTMTWGGACGLSEWKRTVLAYSKAGRRGWHLPEFLVRDEELKPSNFLVSLRISPGKAVMDQFHLTMELINNALNATGHSLIIYGANVDEALKDEIQLCILASVRDNKIIPITGT